MAGRPVGQSDVSFLRITLSGPWAYSTYCSTGSGKPCLVVKRSGRQADYSPSSSPEIKNEWKYTSTPQYALMFFIGRT